MASGPGARAGARAATFQVPYGLLVGPFVAGVAIALFIGFVIGGPTLQVWAFIGLGFGAFGSLLVFMRAVRKHQSGLALEDEDREVPEGLDEDPTQREDWHRPL